MRERKKKRKELREGGTNWGGNERKGRGYVDGGEKKEIRSRCTWVMGKKRKEKRKRKEGGDIQRVERESEEENEKCRFLRVVKEINK